MTVGVRISQRVAAGYRLAGGIVLALAVGTVGAVLLWDGMTQQHMGALAFGMTVLGAEYLVARVALGSFMHPAALLVRRLGARQALAGEMLSTKQALAEAATLGGWPRTPRLFVVDSPQVNAFVTGRKWERVAGVTVGFTEHLAFEEQRAVLASLIAREHEDAGIAEAISSALGPSVSPVPREGVRADFARSMERYEVGDALGVRVLDGDASALARAVLIAYDVPGKISPATPAAADEFFVWPCGQAVTPQEERLERRRVGRLLESIENP